jgi:hypothetical protein
VVSASSAQAPVNGKLRLDYLDANANAVAIQHIKLENEG